MAALIAAKANIEAVDKVCGAQGGVRGVGGGMGGWRRCAAVRAGPLRACVCMGVDACRAALARGRIRVGWQA